MAHAGRTRHDSPELDTFLGWSYRLRRDAVGGERQVCPESSARPRLSIDDGHCVGPGAGGLDLTLSVRGRPGCGLTPFSHPGGPRGSAGGRRSDLQRRTGCHRIRSGGLRRGRRRGGRVGRRRPGTRKRLPWIRTHRSGFRGRWWLERYRWTVGLNRRGIHRLRNTGFGSAGLGQSAGSCRIWNRHDVLPLDGVGNGPLPARRSVPRRGTAESPRQDGPRASRLSSRARFEHARRGESAGGDSVGVGQPKPVVVPNHSIPNMPQQAEELSDEQATFGRS